MLETKPANQNTVSLYTVHWLDKFEARVQNSYS
jgi:hypothetical protein